MIKIIDEPRGALFVVRLTPKAKKDSIAGVHEGMLKVSVTSPPIEGRANTHLIKLLSKKLKVPKSSIEIVSGETSRDKKLLVHGLTSQELMCRLGL